MSTMETAIRRLLAECNGGPGLTAVELSDRLGAPVVILRAELSALVFRKDGGVTCKAEGRYGEGRYVLGDSSKLRGAGAR